MNPTAAPFEACIARKSAHSVRFVFPATIAPVARSRSTRNASRVGDPSTSASDAAVACIRSAVSMLFFHEHGDAVHRTARLGGASVGVERCRDGACVRIRPEHDMQHRSTAIETLDASQIALDEIARRELAARRRRQPFGERALFEIGDAARRRDEIAPAERAPGASRIGSVEGGKATVDHPLSVTQATVGTLLALTRAAGARRRSREPRRDS